jgi:signal transduction histidine kinase
MAMEGMGLRAAIARGAERAALAVLADPPVPAPAGLPAMVDGIARLIEAHSRVGDHKTAEALFAARLAVEPLVDAADNEATARLAIETFAGAAVAALVVGQGQAEAVSEPARLLERIERLTGVPALAVALRTIGDISLLALPLPATTDACVNLISALAPVRKVSLWLRDPPDDLRPVGGPVEDDPSAAHARALARRAMAFESVVSEHGLEVANVNCWHRPCAAIVWLPEDGGEAACRAIAERCAAILGPAFERASLTEENAARSAALKETVERRLTRLGFDLHDGALQDISLLAGELDGLKRRLVEVLAHDPERESVLARVEDIGAIVSFLDSDLRGLASTMDLPATLRKPFEEALNGVVGKFAARSETEPEVIVTGDTDTISDSQRIALLRIVQESLSNIREHSCASKVTISIAAHSTHMEATIHDNGIGFEVDEALRRAAQNGRMGLLGMIERVRLLGGTCHIHSRPFEGTTISLTIARWIPGVGTFADADRAAAAA